MDEMQALRKSVTALEDRVSSLESQLASERERYVKNTREFARVLTEVAAAAGIKLELEEPSKPESKE